MIPIQITYGDLVMVKAERWTFPFIPLKISVSSVQCSVFPIYFHRLPLKPRLKIKPKNSGLCTYFDSSDSHFIISHASLYQFTLFLSVNGKTIAFGPKIPILIISSIPTISISRHLKWYDGKWKALHFLGYHLRAPKWLKRSIRCTLGTCYRPSSYEKFL